MAKKQQPKIDPSRQDFSKVNYDDLISKGNTPGTDSYVSKKKKIFLYFLIGLAFIGTILWCVLSYNKFKAQEEALNLGNGYYDINGDWKSLGGIKTPSLEKQPKKEKVLVPKIEPSNEILNADILSGSFQVGDYIYTLPMKLSDMLDTGLVAVDDRDLTQVTKSSNTQGKLLLQYDEYTYFYVGTYDTEEVKLIDATVVTAYQLTSDDYFNENSQYLYLPGGLHVELTEEQAAPVYDVGDGLLTVFTVPTSKGNIPGKQYNYNGKYDFPWKEHNLLMFTTVDGIVDLVEVYKNR